MDLKDDKAQATTSEVLAELEKAEAKPVEEGTTEVEEAPEPIPFMEPVTFITQRAQPTHEQREWLRKHPAYAPMAHGFVNFRDRGTLHPDGTFIPEAQHPPMDGGGPISVGIPVSARR